MANKKWLRIVVPVLIVAIVAGLWLSKDLGRKEADKKLAAITKDNPDFVLEETSVNLSAYQAHGLPVILDFGAEDCPPCQVMRPALEASYEKYMGHAVIKFFDVWKHTSAANDYPVRVIPTQVIFDKEGKPYVPSEETRKSGLEFLEYNRRDSEEHALTVHEGMLTEEQFALILKDLGVSL